MRHLSANTATETRCRRLFLGEAAIWLNLQPCLCVFGLVMQKVFNWLKVQCNRLWEWQEKTKTLANVTARKMRYLCISVTPSNHPFIILTSKHLCKTNPQHVCLGTPEKFILKLNKKTLWFFSKTLHLIKMRDLLHAESKSRYRTSLIASDDNPPKVTLCLQEAGGYL